MSFTVIKHIICELTGYRPGTVDVSQGDRGSRAVSCRLMENGTPWMIPEGATARVAYTLPDGTEGLYDNRPDGTPLWEIAGNIVTVELADQLMAQAGMVQMSILIIGPEGGQLATWPIRVMVSANKAARLTVPEEMPPYGAGFAGKIFFGGADGTVTPLGIGEGVEIVRQEDGSYALVAYGGAGGGGGIKEETDPTVADWAKAGQPKPYGPGNAPPYPVTSVNGKTGAVNLRAKDVGALPEDTKIPGKTSDLSNDAGFITKAVNDLANYFDKVQTLELIAAIPRFRVTVVQQLPAAGEELVLYLVPFATAEGQYLEYIWVDGRWEIIGSQRVDLSGYATEEWVQDYVEEHSGQNVGKCPERLYVEDYKTDKNTWNDAFDALFAECLASGRVACTGGTYYALTAPLYIGNIDVDFENCELSNNVPESESNPACVVLTGAEKKIQKFGTVTGRQSVGILVNTATGVYKFNRLHAKLIQGWYGALWLSTTGYTCCFNEFHVPLLKSTEVALKTWCESRKTKWVNECHFYLASIEQYRSTYPTKLIEMTNATRCNIYNVDLECGDWQTPDPNRTVEVELTDCSDVAFYNPRTKEGYNAVQFRFIGESCDNYIDAEYSKFGTIDSSQMVLNDRHYNVWRGRVVTTSNGSTTNASTLRIYKDMVVPETLTPMTADVTNGITVTSAMIPNLTKLSTKISSGGVPTLLKWSGGNITIDGRFIALLPATIQIMRTGEGVGDILDMDGSTIMAGSELTMGARYNICVDSVAWAATEPVGKYSKGYPYITGVTLAIVGADGITPHIGANGNWYIGTTDTGVKAQGTDGSDGRGIKAIERTSGNGAAGTVDTYTITYTDGTRSTYQVRNGANAKDGKTPVKGEDYFTEADKAEMVSAVISALPKYNGEVVAV